MTTKTKAQPKIVLGTPRDIPFNKLVLAQTNVRRVKSNLSIEELAEDIGRRGLLQNLCVRPQLDDAGAETGLFEVPAGGRRLAALELLVTQKRMAKTAPVPCMVRTDGIAEEDSLAENVQRVALHPLDQYRAFQALRDRGLSDDDIASRFFVSVQVVRQRLKLAAASPALLGLYEEDEISLEQLMAFCITDDHARQEQVWKVLSKGYSQEPHLIRRTLTEGAVRADDRRAVFIGVDAYEAAGGGVVRDLFQQDRGGYLQDPALLDRLASEKLEREAETIRAEGWLWVEAALEHPYERATEMRRAYGDVPELTAEQQAEEEKLRAEAEALETEHAEADEYPDAVDQRLGEIEAALAQLEDRPAVFDRADIARGGVLVSIGSDGALRVERGYVKSEAASFVDPGDDDREADGVDIETSDSDTSPVEDAPTPLPDRLLVDLTAWRTMALRDALAQDPGIAQLALLHALCLALFYHGGARSCLEIKASSASFHGVAGLDDSMPARTVTARHEQWQRALPDDGRELWDSLQAFDADSRAMLLAHCIALTIDATHQPRSGSSMSWRRGDPLAIALGLDPIAAGWMTTVASYLGQVSKAQVLAAVRETKGNEAVARIEGLRKADMARAAETLLVGCGWVPEVLRTPKPADATAEGEEAPESEALDSSEDDVAQPDYAIAAE